MILEEAELRIFIALVTDAALQDFSSANPTD